MLRSGHVLPTIYGSRGCLPPMDQIFSISCIFAISYVGVPRELAHPSALDPGSTMELPVVHQYMPITSNDHFLDWPIITDRVRSTKGRLCFYMCLFVCSQRRYPGQVQTGGGVPQLGPDGGYPRWGMGYPPHQVRMGRVSEVGYPPPAGMGYPLTGMGGTGGGYPQVGIEYLIHRGRHASCVHAVGLSYLYGYFFTTLFSLLTP